MINGKTRLLYLLRLLYERTDEEHPLTTNEIEAFFADHNTVVDRKTIKNDVNTLNECGFDIVTTRSSQNSYFIADRPLELAELKLLIDAVESSKFITTKKSIQLVKKLTALASVYQASELERHLYIADRVKPTNERIYYFVDRVHTAINQQKQISFRYFEYDVKREKVYRNDGKRYQFSPYGLTWNEDHYYAVGYSPKHGKIVTFRVDRMEDVCVLESRADPPPQDFSLPEFAREVFDMYDGWTERVVLRCLNPMMKVVLDRFGDNIDTKPLDSTHFQAEAEVSVSPTFFAWVFQFRGDIEITAPSGVISHYQKMLKEALR